MGKLQTNCKPGRITALLLVFVLLFTACGVETAPESEPTETASETVTESEQAPESETASEPESEPEPTVREDGKYQPINLLFISDNTDWTEYGEHRSYIRYLVENDTLSSTDGSSYYDFAELMKEDASVWQEIGRLTPITYTKDAFVSLFRAESAEYAFPLGVDGETLYDDCAGMEKIEAPTEEGQTRQFFLLLSTRHNGLVLLECYEYPEEKTEYCKLGFVLGKDSGDSIAVNEGLAEGFIGGTCMNDVQWVLDKDGLLTISGNGPAHKPIYRDCSVEFCTIAEQHPIRRIVVEEGVTVLEDDLFYYINTLESAKIAASVTEWGKGLFSCCSALQEVEGGENLLRIPDRCFSSCEKLEGFRIAESVRTIGVYAFYECAAMSLEEIPENVEEIGEYAFADFGDLPRLEIRNGVKIGQDAFWGVKSLKEVVIGEGITTLERWFSNCPAIERITLPSTLKTIAPYALEGIRGLEELKLPDSLQTIGDGAFGACEDLKALEIPASVRVLPQAAFSSCRRLEKITLHEGLEELSQNAFDFMPAVESITIPASVKKIGRHAFMDCTDLKEVIFLGDVKEITFEKAPAGYDDSFYEEQIRNVNFVDKDGNTIDYKDLW